MGYSEIEEVFCLTDDRKYKAFFNIAAESEIICGLKAKEKWITVKDENGNPSMPI